MIQLKTFWFLALFGLPLLAFSQEKDAPIPIEFRAVLHDPVHPTANLFFLDKKGAGTALQLRPQDFSRPQVTQLVNGSLVLYDKADVDPKKPEASLAASCKVPANAKKGIVIILPAPAETKPAYRMVFIEDSAKAFPPGESRVLTLLNIETAVVAGEHKVLIHPGQIAIIPPVKKISEYSMAQTNFYFKQGEAWTTITERQLQYLDDIRRIFIVNTTPEAPQPTVDTIVDTTTP
jgi:hypothetical protein